jgi:hypothetical protein
MSIGRVPGATGIQPSIVDAKGDLIVATAADSVDRLAVGSANQVLTVDSSTATGLKWATPAAGGKVLQVVNATTNTFTTVTSTTYVDSTLTATITPSSATSKVLVLVTQMCTKSNDISGRLRLVRGSTTILDIATDVLLYTGSATQLRGVEIGANYLDSPNTTNATTYKTQIASDGSTFSVQNGGNQWSTITLLEIGV